MRSRYRNIKYIEWRSPEELHADAIEWLSDLEFIKVEQSFLEELIEENTLNLISGDTFSKSREIVNKLSKSIKKVDLLHNKVQDHSNGLEILVDEIKQEKKEEKFKQEHHLLNAEISLFMGEFRDIKNEIFELIKKIMKQNKQKRLLK